MTTELGPGAEFDLIRQLRARWGELAPDIGDDAAVLRPARGEQIVVSTDAALDAVHFRRDWMSFQEVGYRAVTAALSDLAAMAAVPLGVLVSIVLSTKTSVYLIMLADGIADAVRTANTIILGGNLSNGTTLEITTTVVGSTFAPLGRKGARPGDLLYVTGSLGGPNAALTAWRNKKEPAAELRRRFVRPSARIAEARWLATRGAVAAIDISDGLTGDAAHLAAASDVGLEIRVDCIPVFAGATTDDALAGGDEYELLVAARAPLPEDEFADQFGIPLTLIGRAVDGESGVTFSENGKRVAAPPPRGYDHFSR